MQGGSNTLRPEGSASMVESIHMIKALELLQKAIAYGHVEKAKELVGDLAKQKARVSVTEQPEKPTTAFEEDIRVKVYVEDKDLSGSHIFMRMKPSLCIKRLKQMMQEKHGFAPEIQKWIVSRRLVKDEETLHKLRITNESSMFLYLLSPQSVGLTKEDYTCKYGDNFQAMRNVHGDYMDMGGVRRQSSGGATPSPGLTRNNPLTGGPRRATDAPPCEMPAVTEAEEHTEYAEILPLSMPQMQPPPPPPLRKPKQEVGWRCLQCTYFNEPTRPGCEMCAADRPQDYQVPQDYQPTGREKRRLEQEKAAETLAKQSDKKERAVPLDTDYAMHDLGLLINDEEEVVLRGQLGVNIQEEDELGMMAERLRLETDASLAKMLQKQEEEDFERRHRGMQRNRNSEGEDVGPELVREAYPMQETGGPLGRTSVEESDESNELVEQQLLAQQNYSYMLESFSQPVISNKEQFDCAICYDTVPPEDGIILRECLHEFCRSCVSANILVNEEACVKCPYQDENFSCPAVLLDSEVKALVKPEDFEKYLQRSLVQAESQASDSYHCKTPDCGGWCVYDDDVNFFFCPVCENNNCLTCKAIHEGQNCREYQNDLRINAENDQAAKQTQKALQEMLESGDGMECPQCRVIITKKVGCDWLRCTMCRTEICWVTKGRRWGPGGTGDTNGGCRCNTNGKRCHPNCQNCH